MGLEFGMKQQESVAPITYPSIVDNGGGSITFNYKRTTSNGSDYAMIYTGTLTTTLTSAQVKSLSLAGPSGSRVWTHFSALTQNVGYSDDISLSPNTAYTIWAVQANAGGVLDGSPYYQHLNFTTSA